MAYWWVNHKQTRDHEVRGGYLWSPKRNQNGAYNQTYENMRLAGPGDIVYSYAHGRIGAVGVVMGRATPCPKPTEFGRVGDYWSSDGWLLPVAFAPIDHPIRPGDHLGLIAPLLPDKHSPIRTNGLGNQGVYLAAISNVLGVMLGTLTDAPPQAAIQEADATPAAALEDVAALESNPALGPTERAQLVQARIGQGLFRVRVLMNEQCCKVTGVRDQRVLRASHMKPWRASSNAERLDPDNGLLLSPHLDALFDQELISFEDNGRMIVRPDLPLEVLRRWTIDHKAQAEPFRPGQQRFLSLHRESLSNRWRSAK